MKYSSVKYNNTVFSGVKPVVTAVIIAVLFILTACTGSPEPVSESFFCLDTLCTITLYDMKDMNRENAQRVIERSRRLCQSYEAMFSPYMEGSDINRINNSGNLPVTCHAETLELLKKGLFYSDLSGGKLDLSIGSVSSLWDFHGDSPVLPSKEALHTALESVGYESIRISGNEVCLELKGERIDPGAIAKGYIADRVCELLKEEEVSSAIVNLGGNVCVTGDKKGLPFSVGIETPYSDRKEISAVTKASDETLVTCGVYERYFEKDGRKYHHVLSVNDGYPVETDLLSVTIRSSLGHSADCDALSTICLIIGSRDATELIEAMEGYEAFMITEDGSQVLTSGFFR